MASYSAIPAPAANCKCRRCSPCRLYADVVNNDDLAVETADILILSSAVATHVRARQTIADILAQFRAGKWRRYLSPDCPGVTGRSTLLDASGAINLRNSCALDPDYELTQEDWVVSMRAGQSYDWIGDGVKPHLSIQYSLDDGIPDYDISLELTNAQISARRVAATYARLYLETEEGGSPEHKGRYYWMAIGAFASKTVARTFDAWQVKTLEVLSKTVKDGLGKGNFWLFCDISGWHWYHNMYRKSFDQCLSERNSERYVREVKDQLRQLPWNTEALPKINNLRVSPHIIAGFEKVRQFEQATAAKRPDFQFGNLIDLANHEQGVILQPLIYNDPTFAEKIDLQRSWWVSWASPTVELVF